MWFFSGSRAAGPNRSDLALYPVLVSPVDSYSCTLLRRNSHGMMLLQKSIGGRGGSTETLTLSPKPETEMGANSS